VIRGNNPILLNVTYNRPDVKKGIEEYFEVIYKTEDGRIYKSNEPAEVDIYFVKPEFRTFNYNKPQERIERLEKRRVLISKIRYEIARDIGEEGERFIQECFENKDYKGLDRLYGWRYSFGCDFQPEFYFMRDWYNKYQLGNVRLTKAFIDIETDLIDFTPDLDKLSGTAYAPVNCATIFLEETKECYTFLLKPYKPSKMGYLDADEYKVRYDHYESQLAQHEKLMGNMDKFIKSLNDSFDEMYGNAKYIVRDYKDEIELIADIFRLINDRKPNFCMAWNMRFDIQYLLERIKALGYDPRSIMCHPDFENPKCYFHVDKLMFNLEKQYDYFTCSSYTHYLCQMRLFASIRKSQQMLKSVSLNAISDRELKDQKIEYPPETNMVYFPYMDWARFVMYNVKDVLLQVGIERKTNDCMTYYMKSHSNLTPYNKIFRETHLLRNVRERYFNEDGWVQGNNLNIIDSDESDPFYSVGDEDDDDNESTFKGAITANPIWNDNVGMEILGSPSNVVYENSIDMDMGAFYPSIKIACNMDQGTLVFKSELDNEEFMSGEFQNRSPNTIYQEKDKNGKMRNLDLTGEVVNCYVSGNNLTFGYNYLGLPSVTELCRDVMKEMNRK